MEGRYQRHSLITWFDQARLAAAKVVVVGAGAVGNEVLKDIALLGVGHIHVIDLDHIEDHNLTRCVLFRDSDVGLPKAKVAADACSRIDPNLEVRASTGDFWRTLSIAEIAQSDAVLACVDNLEARVRLNLLCQLAGTDLYNIGIDSQFVTAEVFPFSGLDPCACFECTLPSSAYDRLHHRYSCGALRKVAYDEKKVPTTAITASLAAATAVSLLLHSLHAHSRQFPSSTRYFQDTISLESRVSTIQRAAQCFGCLPANELIVRTSAKRTVMNDSVIPFATDPPPQISFSEPVLLATDCQICGHHRDYLDSASKYTDALLVCPVCSNPSVKPEVVHHLDIRSIISRFADAPIPCKFITFTTHSQLTVIELED